MPHLTQRIVDRVSEPGEYMHDNPKGLMVRVYDNGTKVFAMRFMHKGRREYITLGPTNETSLYAAEILAKDYKAKIRMGNHPKTEVGYKHTTLNALMDQFLDKHVLVHLKPTTQELYQVVYNKYVRPTPLGRKLVDKLEKADFRELHASMQPQPYQANRLLAVLSSMFTWADDNKLIKDSWNPVRGIRRYREKERKKLLSPEERQKFEDALQVYPNRQAVLIFRLLMFTGARVSELLSLKWSEVRMDAGLIHKEDSKTGERTIFLTAPAEAVLREAKKWCGDSPYVFPMQRNWQKAYTYSGIRQHWDKFRTLAGLDDLRIHDLRHHFGSSAAKKGMSLPMIGELLGHSQMSTTRRYVHFSVAHLKEQAERLAEELSV